VASPGMIAPPTSTPRSSTTVIVVAVPKSTAIPLPKCLNSA